MKKPPKKLLRYAVESIEKAKKDLESVQHHFDMVWGVNKSSTLNTDIEFTLTKLQEAKQQIEQTLAKYKGKPLNPN